MLHVSSICCYLLKKQSLVLWEDFHHDGQWYNNNLLKVNAGVNIFLFLYLHHGYGQDIVGGNCIAETIYSVFPDMLEIPSFTADVSCWFFLMKKLFSICKDASSHWVLHSEHSGLALVGNFLVWPWWRTLWYGMDGELSGLALVRNSLVWPWWGTLWFRLGGELSGFAWVGSSLAWSWWVAIWLGVGGIFLA